MPSLYTNTPPWRIWLKVRVNLSDQTAKFIPFKVIRTAILMYFYLFLGINLRISISVINMRFQADAPGGVIGSIVNLSITIQLVRPSVSF